MSALAISAARADDLTAIRAQLETEGLPGSDISETSLKTFRVARDGSGIAGAIGIEIHGDVALLRSLVVAAKYRGQGLGARLTEDATALAARAGCASVYLLTATATEFFLTRGFRAVARGDTPSAIQSTTQFSSLCPASAVVMVKP